MSYESKVIIANTHRETNKKDKNYGKVYYAEILCVFNLSCMGSTNGWRSLFNKEIDFELFIEDGDHSTKEDKYGAVMKEADIQEVIQWLETKGAEMNYRRVPPILASLKAINPEQWDELHVVHYGY